MGTSATNGAQRPAKFEQHVLGVGVALERHQADADGDERADEEVLDRRVEVAAQRGLPAVALDAEHLVDHGDGQAEHHRDHRQPQVPVGLHGGDRRPRPGRLPGRDTLQPPHDRPRPSPGMVAGLPRRGVQIFNAGPAGGGWSTGRKESRHGGEERIGLRDADHRASHGSRGRSPQPGRTASPRSPASCSWPSSSRASSPRDAGRHRAPPRSWPRASPTTARATRCRCSSVSWPTSRSWCSSPGCGAGSAATRGPAA